MNTEFTYQYQMGEVRRVVLLGALTTEEKRAIHQACHNGTFFIPNLVGLPMLVPAEANKDDDTAWHHTADPALRDVDEGVSPIAHCCEINAASALYEAFMAIKQTGGWHEEATAPTTHWGPLLLGTEEQDDSRGTDRDLTNATHIALITLPNDSEDNMRVGARQEWVVLRAPRGRTAVQTLIADHPDLLIPERDADTPLAICIITPSHIEKFDLTTHYKEFQDKQIREAAAEIEAAERQQLQELLAKYPDEIT